MDHLIRILIIEDHAFVQTSLRSILKLEPRLIVVAEAENGSDAVALVEKHRPDMVVMDISLSVLNGIEATRIITSKFRDTKVIILTMHIDQNYSACAYAVGACCVLIKGCNKDEILSEIMNCSL